MPFPSDMTAPPAGALEACLALLVEQMDMLRDDYVSYSEGKATVPFVVLRDALVAALNAYDDARPALLAALRLREWKPIAEAPKDGRNVLIFCKDAVIPAIAFFCEDAGSWMSIAGESFAQPILWMPAPIPTANDLARVGGCRMSANNNAIAPEGVLAVLHRHVDLAEEVASPDQIAEARGVLDYVAELVKALQEIAECTTPGKGVPNTDWVHERACTALVRVLEQTT